MFKGDGTLSIAVDGKGPGREVVVFGIDLGGACPAGGVGD